MSAAQPLPLPDSACQLLPGAARTRPGAAYQDGRLVVMVTGADAGRVHDALAGLVLTIRSGPSLVTATAGN